MTDIKISLTIKDGLATPPGQRGCAIAYDALSHEVHIEAYGFEPSKAGGVALAEMMYEVINALQDELGTVDERPRLDHNILDAACRERKSDSDYPASGAARCPICRPVRPPFSPQPAKKQ